MNYDKNKSNLKIFFIKLICITLSIIVIINLTYNLIFADKLENLNNFLSINNKESNTFSLSSPDINLILLSVGYFSYAATFRYELNEIN